MRRIGVVANESKPQAGKLLEQLGRECRRLDMKIFASRRTIEMTGFGQAVGEQDLVGRIEGMLALGGDGTLLRAARLLNGVERPLMGLNLGSLGYLTSLASDQLEQALDALRHDRYKIGRRAKLRGRVLGREGEQAITDALNDIVISRGASGRVVGLEMEIDGKPVTTYVCDGLIVSTPTGSTAYAMAAGGPIIMPETAAIGISVICPHTLSSRPLVLPDSMRLAITVRWGSDPLLLSVDGQDDHELHIGDRVEIELSPRVACLALLPGHNAFAVLSRKLGWGLSGHKGTPGSWKGPSGG